MLRASRSRASERFLYSRIWLFVLAASSGLLGIASGVTWLTTVAIVLLAAAVVLRLIGARQDEAADRAAHDESVAGDATGDITSDITGDEGRE